MFTYDSRPLPSEEKKCYNQLFTLSENSLFTGMSLKLLGGYTCYEVIVFRVMPKRYLWSLDSSDLYWPTSTLAA